MTLPPCPMNFNMAAHVLRHAKKLSEHAALVVVPKEVWTYAALIAAVRGTATGLLQTGLSPGDRVLLRLGNSVDFPIAYLGAIAAGLVPAPTSAQLSAVEITPMAQALRPALVIGGPGVALPDLPEVPVCAIDALRAWRSLPPADWHGGDPNRPAYVVFTSGTAAVPRGVVHAHRAVWARQAGIEHWAAMRHGDRVLHAGAFNWTYTLGTGLMDPWTVGATAIIPAEGTPAEDLPSLIAEQDATIFAAVPGVYRRLLKSDLPALPRLRHGLSAGEKLPEGIREGWRAVTGTDIHEAYGQSECSTFISGAPVRPAPPGTLGRAQPGRRVAILGTDGTPVRPGVSGDLAIATDDPGLMRHYLDGDAPHGGWFATGDVASMDADGWITYLGRADDVMTAGGYRVSPLEIEAVALGVPGIHEAAAFEQEVKPGVRLIAIAYRADADLDETLLAHCAERLARYKQPRLAIRLDTIPKNPNGKVLRRALREETP